MSRSLLVPSMSSSSSMPGRATVVGYAVGRSIDVGLTLAAFRNAIEEAGPRLPIRARALPPGRCQELPRRIDGGSLGNPSDKAKAASVMKRSRSRPSIPWPTRPSRMSRPIFFASSMTPKIQAAFTRLSRLAAVRGSIRPALGQNRSLILSTRKGARHFKAMPGTIEADVHHDASHANHTLLTPSFCREALHPHALPGHIRNAAGHRRRNGGGLRRGRHRDW